MASIIIKGNLRIKNQLTNAIRKRAGQSFKAAEIILRRQAERYKNEFANSPEYFAMKHEFAGKFGFTPEELSNLDRILELMVPGNHEVTTIKAVDQGKKKLLVLEWVDFEKLKEHPYAKHDLTRLDATGQVVEKTDTISWIDWLENGEFIPGYQFFKPNSFNIGHSRSGKGLMRISKGGSFTLEPSRVFEKIITRQDAGSIRREFIKLVKVKRGG